MGALAVKLWTIHNKLVIEHSPLRRSSDALYKLCGFLQPWMPLGRGPEHDDIETLTAGLISASLGAPTSASTTGSELGA